MHADFLRYGVADEPHCVHAIIQANGTQQIVGSVYLGGKPVMLST